MVVRVPSLPQLKFGDDQDDDDEEEEFEWVTDSDEEDPEFECDSCGRVIEDTADRFHCETCGDYDLVRSIVRPSMCLVWRARRDGWDIVLFANRCNRKKFNYTR